VSEHFGNTSVNHKGSKHIKMGVFKIVRMWLTL